MPNSNQSSPALQIYPCLIYITITHEVEATDWDAAYEEAERYGHSINTPGALTVVEVDVDNPY